MEKQIAGDEAELLNSWHRDGLIILRGLFSRQAMDEVNALIDELWQNRQALNAPITIDTELDSSRSRRQRLCDVTAEMRKSPYKINDLYMEYALIRQIVLDPRLARTLSLALGGHPMVCNTLNLEYGSQQDEHVDTFYMPSRKQNGMVASWIALEDVDAGNGPVKYYPGSHRIPPYYFSHGKTNAIAREMPAWRAWMDEQIRQRSLQPVSFAAQAGDVLIWHSQLLHGGMPITRLGATRRSLVTHYFRRQDYLHHLWRVRREHTSGYWYRRQHQPVHL